MAGALFCRSAFAAVRRLKKFSVIFRETIFFWQKVLYNRGKTFAATYAGQSPLNLDGGEFGSTAFVAAAGAYLMTAGGVVSGVTLILSKLK